MPYIVCNSNQCAFVTVVNLQNESTIPIINGTIKNRVNAINVGNTKRAKYFLYVFCINLPPTDTKCFLPKTEERRPMTASFPLRILCTILLSCCFFFRCPSATVSDTTASHFCYRLHTQEEMHHNHL